MRVKEDSLANIVTLEWELCLAAGKMVDIMAVAKFVSEAARRCQAAGGEPPLSDWTIEMLEDLAASAGSYIEALMAARDATKEERGRVEDMLGHSDAQDEQPA